MRLRDVLRFYQNRLREQWWPKLLLILLTVEQIYALRGLSPLLSPLHLLNVTIGVINLEEVIIIFRLRKIN